MIILWFASVLIFTKLALILNLCLFVGRGVKLVKMNLKIVLLVLNFTIVS